MNFFKKNNKRKILIPEIKRDGSLISRLLAVTIGGFDTVLDKESRLYLRLLVRLIDKSYDEYNYARNCLLREIKDNDKLEFRFSIINSFENCICAVARAGKIFSTLNSGNLVVFDYSKKENIILNKNLEIQNLIDKKNLKKITKKNVLYIRNRIEHIDQDIYKDSFEDDLFLDINFDYKKICINNKNINLSDLIKLIESYHNAVLEVFSRLPKKWENGKFYWEV